MLQLNIFTQRLNSKLKVERLDRYYLILLIWVDMQVTV